MKLILILLSIAIASNGYSQPEIHQDSMAIEYSAQSRGTFKEIKINKKIISVIKVRGGSPIIKPCNHRVWETLTNLLKYIDIKTISNLKAPSKKFEFDAAAIAHLTIRINDASFKTKSFDHGNPPKEIADLVKEILSIAENIE
ncbi:hypothetical protein GSB9_02392 [Flavobacteriaceae bacterium GSB9]|nr:hypothetical protein GSB9_02392 [Flavobacteriaceae bacterium GSB9]